MLAVVAALVLLPVTKNPYIELLGETLFVSLVLLFAFVLAGAWRQTLVPRWVAQVLAIALGAIVSPLVVQLFSTGGDLSAFLGSGPHVRGYVLVTLSAAVIGTLLALGALTASGTPSSGPRHCSSRWNARRCSARRATPGSSC